MSSEDVFKTSLRRLDQGEYIRVSHTSSEDVFKMYWKAKKSLHWRCGEDIFKTCLKDVFKTSWRPTKYLQGNALAKISVKGHNTLWKSKQASNLLSTSHNLDSKYAYNVYKSKNKFWFRETSWKSDRNLLLRSLLVDENANAIFFKREEVY